MKIQIENKDVNLPDFLMIGSAKCGTTTIFQYLQQQPSIFLPENKEPFYFSFGNKPSTYTDSRFNSMVTWKKEEYFKLFETAGTNQIIGEASTSYLYTATKTIENIKSIYGKKAHELKIIVILRNPTDRAFSHYTHLVRNGIEKLTFKEAIKSENIDKRSKEMWGFDYTGYGMYGEQFKPFKEYFKNILVLQYEELSEPKLMMGKIYNFLGITNPIVVDKVIEANPSGIPKSKIATSLIRNKRIKKIIKSIAPNAMFPALQRLKDRLLKKSVVKPEMSIESRQYLRSFFQDDISLLESLINKDLSSWK
ncbi:MAG: hypothetical protein RL204_523 [Bacteroidota bacterium]|jgi:hypothetical protein